MKSYMATVTNPIKPPLASTFSSICMTQCASFCMLKTWSDFLPVSLTSAPSDVCIQSYTQLMFDVSSAGIGATPLPPSVLLCVQRFCSGKLLKYLSV